MSKQIVEIFHVILINEKEPEKMGYTKTFQFNGNWPDVSIHDFDKIKSGLINLIEKYSSKK